MKLQAVPNVPNFYLDLDSGIYYVRKMVKGRVYERSTGTRNLKDALKRYQQILDELDDRKLGITKRDVPTLDQWWTDYRGAKKKSARTWKREEEIMRLHILPTFGRLRLDEITQNAIERYLNRRRATKVRKGPEGEQIVTRLAEGTVTREQSLLHAIFQAAVDDDLIHKNPLKKIPRTPYATRQIVLSVSDQAKLKEKMTPLLYRWLIFSLGTGCRIEEIRGINPNRDIDWDAPSVTVTGKGHNGEPKVRTVPLLDDELVRILREQIAENDGDPKRHRSKRKGTLWAQEQSFFRKELTKACKEADVPYISPHILRHTFATRYLQSGGSIFILSQILGHHSVEITQRVYAHLVTKDHAKLSEKVNLHLTSARVLPFNMNREVN